MTKAVTISDSPVMIEDIIDVASGKAILGLDDSVSWRDRIARCRTMLLKAVENGKVVYGMNTGVGNSSKIQLSPGSESRLQQFIIAQHGCGVGPDLSEYEALAVSVTRLVSLSKGYSAVRFELLEQIVAIINAGIVPAIPRLGSVGASGDLTPLSYLAAMLTGERDVYVNGSKLPARDALKAAGIKPLSLASKEGIAIMNGTAVITAVGILAHRRALNCCDLAARASALATEVMCGDSGAFAPEIHSQKPFPGQVKTAAQILDSLSGSSLIRWAGETRQTKAQKADRPVQDRYSLRCSPHVIGATRDSLDWIATMLTTELNSVNDNPMVDPDTGEIFMGGNFYGGHVALAMDLMKISLASLCDLLDRQFAHLVDESANRGLPESLLMPREVDDPEFGLYHGLKGLQLTMSALTAMAIQRAGSDTLTSRPTESGNQDKVSMGTNAAHNACAIVELTEQCLAILLVALSQAAFIRNESRVSPAGRELVKEVRKWVPVIERDRPLDGDVASLAAWITARAFDVPPVDACRISRSFTLL